MSVSPFQGLGGRSVATLSAPSPLVGEGRGEGSFELQQTHLLWRRPLTLTLSREGRGDGRRLRPPDEGLPLITSTRGARNRRPRSNARPSPAAEIRPTAPSPDAGWRRAG